jgi:hypothetical protein
MKWTEFDPSNIDLPERKPVLCQIADRPNQGLPPAVAVGYLRIFSNGPMFIVPGVGGVVTHYCDCLPDDFIAPLWPGTPFTARWKR